MIGYSAHGVGPLCPPEPEHECCNCHGMLWHFEDLDGDGWCEDCQITYCKSCGEAKEDPDDDKCRTCDSVYWADSDSHQFRYDD